MKPNILGLRTLIYQVCDLDAAKAWYTRAFGQAPYFDEPFYVGFSIGGYELGLQPLEGEPAPKSFHSTTYWGVEDVDATLAHFIELGGIEHEARQEVGGGIIVCSVKDPWDNLIGLIYNPHFALPDS